MVGRNLRSGCVMPTMTSIKNWGRICLIVPRWKNDGGLVGRMAGAIDNTGALSLNGFCVVDLGGWWKKIRSLYRSEGEECLDHAATIARSFFFPAVITRYRTVNA